MALPPSRVLGQSGPKTIVRCVFWSLSTSTCVTRFSIGCVCTSGITERKHGLHSFGVTNTFFRMVVRIGHFWSLVVGGSFNPEPAATEKPVFAVAVAATHCMGTPSRLNESRPKPALGEGGHHVPMVVVEVRAIDNASPPNSTHERRKWAAESARIASQTQSPAVLPTFQHGIGFLTSVGIFNVATNT